MGDDMATAQQTAGTRRRTTRREPIPSAREGAPKPEEGAEKATRRTATVPVPVITPRLTVHRVHMPMSGRGVANAGKAVTSSVPAPEGLVYYAGLGALTAFGVVEWPVALAIGVGVGIARRRGRSGERRPAQESPRQEQEKNEEQ